MQKYDKIFPGDSCPNCGDELIVTTDSPPQFDTELQQYFYDGDPVKCESNCGFISCISADGESAWVQDGNIDDLVE